MAAFAADADVAKTFSVAAWVWIRSLEVGADVFLDGVARLAVATLVAAGAADFLAGPAVCWRVEAFDALVDFWVAALFAGAFLAVALLGALESRDAGALPFAFLAGDDFAGGLAAALVPLTFAAVFLVPLTFAAVFLAALPLVAVFLAEADFPAAEGLADLVTLVLVAFRAEVVAPSSAFAMVARLPLVALAATVLTALAADSTLVAISCPSLPGNHRACGDERIAVLPNAPYIDAPQ